MVSDSIVRPANMKDVMMTPIINNHTIVTIRSYMSTSTINDANANVSLWLLIKFQVLFMYVRGSTFYLVNVTDEDLKWPAG